MGQRVTILCFFDALALLSPSSNELHTILNSSNLNNVSFGGNYGYYQEYNLRNKKAT